MGDLLERNITTVVTIASLESNMSIIIQEEVAAIDVLHNSASKMSDKRSRRIMELRRRF